MTHDDPKRPDDPGRAPAATGDEAPGQADREAGRVPQPAPEEAPELLGERSDYPIAREDEER